MKNLKEQLQERIPTLEAAFSETSRPKVDFSVYPEDLRENREAEYNAIVIVEAARKIERENGLGEIDWDDYNQRKWTPWFLMSAAAFAFYSSNCDRTSAHAASGSRLRVLSEASSDYIAETFPDIWKAIQIG
ncbi:hypothetical protein [Dysgonomonas sp. ZJ279]|uniref:hypothetical protein n=1 Tax=Dysgonomonas sp. ZJ279 TaxID=2709796 RepID=UPI0013EA3170|nr:hypothetical protein [Dysgonomonas sp. ZJ279]